MNSETRYDRVEASKIRQRLAQVVVDDSNSISAIESLAGGVQHCGRKVECNAFRSWPVKPDQRQKPAISRSEIKNPLDRGRDEIEQDGLAFRAMGNPICSREIFQRVL